MFVDLVPGHVTHVCQAGDGGAALVDLDLLPVVLAGTGGELGWGGESVTFAAGPAASTGARWGGLEQGGVAAHPGGQVHASGAGAGEGGVGAVGGQVQVPAGEPGGDLGQHRGGVRDGGGVVVFAVQPQSLSSLLCVGCSLLMLVGVQSWACSAR